MSADNSFQRVLAAVEDLGLSYRETERGKRAQLQTPGHSEKDRGTSIAYNGDRTLIYCHNGDTDDVLQALGLELKDLFDNPKGSEYHYRDARTVFRSIDKKFTQRGNTKGTQLFGESSRYENNTVYVVEGENDVLTAINVCEVNAVSQAQGASTNPNKADWSPLAGKNVVIVADDDKPGMKRATTVSMYLQQLPEAPATIRVVKAKIGKDLSDHVAAGLSLGDLVEVQKPVARRHVKLVRATDVKTEKINWLIDSWIAENTLSLLAGREGIGKSTIACDWVAQFTKAGMKCAYLNSEDSRSFTVKPRLQAAGANLDLVTFIDVETEEGYEGKLILPQDTMILADALVAEGVQFVVLDAAKSSMNPKLDGNKDDHVRQFLEPLIKIADAHRITLLGLVHLGKKDTSDTGKSILGSIAWSQVARSVLVAAIDRKTGKLIVSNEKGNLAPSIVSREAGIVNERVTLDDGNTADIGRIKWGEFTEITAGQLLESQPSSDQVEERNEVEAVVVDYLISCGGSAPANDVLKFARMAGLNEQTVKNSRRKFGVVTRKNGYGKGWVWSLERESVPSDVFDIANQGTAEDTGEDTNDTKRSSLEDTEDTEDTRTPLEQSALGMTDTKIPPKKPISHAQVSSVPSVSSQEIENQSVSSQEIEDSFFQHPEPTLTPPPVPALTVTDEDRNKVLDFLQEDYGLSSHVIAGSLQQPEERVQAILHDLETRNLAYAKKGKYQKVVKAA